MSSITLFGTTDNYNTEQTEHLHINFTKDAYHATNRKDKYKQMTVWLERHEKVQQHAASIRQGQNEQARAGAAIPIGPPQVHHSYLKMAQNPTINSASFDDLDKKYSTDQFQDTLADFIAHMNYPGASGPTLRKHAENTPIPFCAVPVFYRIKFTAHNHYKSEVVDAVHVQPERLNSRGQIKRPRFDTVLVRNGLGQGGTHGSNGKSVHINV